jgi:hypothetical protein
MTIELTDDEASRLRELLDDYVPQLRREVARTEERTLRHEMVLRQELCERIIAQLGAPTPG